MRGDKHLEVAVVYGNHGAVPIQLEDYHVILEESFLESGVRFRHSESPVPGILNVLIECFDKDLVQDLIEMKAEHPATEYICIATEVVTGSTFNRFEAKSTDSPYASFLKHLSRRIVRRLVKMLTPPNSRFRKTLMYENLTRAQDHYSNLYYWEKRFRNFSRLAPHFKAVWCSAEFLLPGYRALLPHTSVNLMPVVTFREQPQAVFASEKEQDVDFLFTGTVTAYRAEFLGALKRKGYKVVAGSSLWPRYFREHFLRRAKVCLDMRQSPHWRAPSPMRLHRLLVEGRLVVSEKGDMTCFEDGYVELASSDDFVRICEEQLRLGDHQRRGLEASHRYLKDLEPKRREMRRLIESALAV